MPKNLFLSPGMAIFHHNSHGANEEQMKSLLKNVFWREEEMIERETSSEDLDKRRLLSRDSQTFATRHLLHKTAHLIFQSFNLTTHLHAYKISDANIVTWPVIFKVTSIYDTYMHVSDCCLKKLEHCLCCKFDYE